MRILSHHRIHARLFELFLLTDWGKQGESAG